MIGNQAKDALRENGGNVQAVWTSASAGQHAAAAANAFAGTAPHPFGTATQLVLDARRAVASDSNILCVSCEPSTS